MKRIQLLNKVWSMRYPKGNEKVALFLGILASHMLQQQSKAEHKWLYVARKLSFEAPSRVKL